MYPRLPADSRPDDAYRPPTNLTMAVAVALAVPLALLALTTPPFAVGVVAGAFAATVAR